VRPGVVSVVIPTYNRNFLLFNRSLSSVLRQTYRDIEVHVVCDGMQGEELDDLEQRMLALNDWRVTVWNIQRQSYPEDPGQKWCVLGLNARNKGLDHASGEWVTSLDDDDEWTDDHIEVLLKAATELNKDFVYGISEYHWPDGRPQRAGSWPPGYGAFCDGAQLYKNGMGYRYDPECIGRGLPEDGDLWNRMVAGGVTFAFVPTVVHHYFVNPR